MAKQVSEGSLHKWFNGSKSKDGKGGWVNVVTGGTCASDEPGEGTPKCVSSAKRASMTKAERLSAARRKKKADPGQQSKSGAAKPTYVSTDSPRKKKKKKMNEGWSDKYKQSIDCDNPKGFSQKAHCQGKKKMKETYQRSLTPLTEKAKKCWPGYEKKGTKKMFGKTYNNCVKKEEVEITEGKDKKGKGSGTKDACYHKVKSRYSVWPSAYASGALVKCRKVGAANWGNSKKESFSDWKSEFIWEGGDSSKKIEEAITPMQFVGAIDKNKVARGQRVPQMQDKTRKRDFDDPVNSKPSLTKPDSQVTQDADKPPVSQPSGEIKQLSPQNNVTSMIQNRNSSIKKMMKNPVMSSHELEGEDITETPYGRDSNFSRNPNKRDFLHRIKRDEDGNIIKPEKRDFLHRIKKDAQGNIIPPKIAPMKNQIMSSYDWRAELEEDWQKTNRQDKTDGMSQKAVNAYRRENPGSKLKTAVTAKPSSLKRGSKSAKRRKSFCSRMKGMKKRLTSAKTARDPDSRINKALRRWNC